MRKILYENILQVYRNKLTLKTYNVLFNVPVRVASDKTAKYSMSADDDVFIYLAKEYAAAHKDMFTGPYCAHGVRHPDKVKFKDGITNGAAWYPIIGPYQC